MKFYDNLKYFLVFFLVLYQSFLSLSKLPELEYIHGQWLYFLRCYPIYRSQHALLSLTSKKYDTIKKSTYWVIFEHIKFIRYNHHWCREDAIRTYRASIFVFFFINHHGDLQSDILKDLWNIYVHVTQENYSYGWK